MTSPAGMSRLARTTFALLAFTEFAPIASMIIGSGRNGLENQLKELTSYSTRAKLARIFLICNPFGFKAYSFSTTNLPFELKSQALLLASGNIIADMFENPNVDDPPAIRRMYLIAKISYALYINSIERKIVNIAAPPEFKVLESKLRQMKYLSLMILMAPKIISSITNASYHSSNVAQDLASSSIDPLEASKAFVEKHPAEFEEAALEKDIQEAENFLEFLERPDKTDSDETKKKKTQIFKNIITGYLDQGDCLFDREIPPAFEGSLPNVDRLVTVRGDSLFSDPSHMCPISLSSLRYAVADYTQVASANASPVQNKTCYELARILNYLEQNQTSPLTRLPMNDRKKNITLDKDLQLKIEKRVKAYLIVLKKRSKQENWPDRYKQN